MKLLTVIMFLWGSLFELIPDIKMRIDYNPKRLIKEIENCFIDVNYHKTEIVLSDSIINENAIAGKYFRIINNDSTIGYIYIGRVNSCRMSGCSVQKNITDIETSEFFDYFMIFNRKKEILAVVVYNYAATHGQEVTARGWLKQFVGYDGYSDLNVGKNVDAISGATISVFSLVEDIKSRTILLNKINQEVFN